MTAYDLWRLTDPYDINDAEHPNNCRCRECDPDWHMDLARERREDAA